MKPLEFLNKIINLFPCSDEESVLKERISRYSKILKDKEIREQKKIDYEKSLDFFIENYSYRSFPNFTEICKYIKFFPDKNDVIECPKHFIIKRGGYCYDFVQVPSSFEGARNISEFSNVVEVR